MIDVGGESTRPGALGVDAKEQVRRIEGVVKRLAKAGMMVSVDTTLVEVAKAGLDAGAVVINDVSAGRDWRNGEGEKMFALAAERECGLVVMHRLREPSVDSYSDAYTDAPVYGDVVEDVKRFLVGRCERACEMGVKAERLMIDPGLGYGKTVAQNFELVRGSGEFVRMGYAVLGAGSRKSFLGAVSGIKDAGDRGAVSVALSVVQYMLGVRVFRVHGVRAHREGLSIVRAMTGNSQ